MVKRILSSWPKLIGLAVGAFGLGGVTSEIADRPRFGWSRHLDVHFYVSVSASTGLLFFLLLGYPLYRGHRWAYCLLLFSAIFIFASCATFTILQVLHTFGRPVHSTVESIGTIGFGIAFLAPPLFLIAVLLHPDVIATFPRKPSNQKMELTASRGTAQFSDD